eukprot:GHVS01048851.1.p1 GENE.GHVS01048851.1~~GHVS01048851.1.p1  ORF type:complete len:636 (-),score=120.88 GHVS01048851.1:253-1989(-)
MASPDPSSAPTKETTVSRSPSTVTFQKDSPDQATVSVTQQSSSSSRTEIRPNAQQVEGRRRLPPHIVKPPIVEEIPTVCNLLTTGDSTWYGGYRAVTFKNFRSDKDDNGLSPVKPKVPIPPPEDPRLPSPSAVWTKDIKTWHMVPTALLNTPLADIERPNSNHPGAAFEPSSVQVPKARRMEALLAELAAEAKRAPPDMLLAFPKKALKPGEVARLMWSDGSGARAGVCTRTTRSEEDDREGPICNSEIRPEESAHMDDASDKRLNWYSDVMSKTVEDDEVESIRQKVKRRRHDFVVEEKMNRLDQEGWSEDTSAFETESGEGEEGGRGGEREREQVTAGRHHEQRLKLRRRFRGNYLRLKERLAIWKHLLLMTPQEDRSRFVSDIKARKKRRGDLDVTDLKDRDERSKATKSSAQRDDSIPSVKRRWMDEERSVEIEGGLGRQITLLEQLATLATPRQEEKYADLGRSEQRTRERENTREDKEEDVSLVTTLEGGPPPLDFRKYELNCQFMDRALPWRILQSFAKEGLLINPMLLKGKTKLQIIQYLVELWDVDTMQVFDFWKLQVRRQAAEARQFG